ncbi:alpha/beta hydrolase family protein [Pseudoalteromonas spongiae]|uniref:alpha/beta hydrolase family protein n=1 Tax=Pseudoalteromonas spongiae TaxID=298657 RepID=UPI000C2D4215|nr:alpha/beta fold hydrolase [Pseudoalteromonas spongiae]
MIKKNWMKITLTTITVLTLLAIFWYTKFALKPYQVTPHQLAETYSYQVENANVTLTQLENGHYAINYQSFDGENVNGQLVYPKNYDGSKPVPLLIGVHAMGRSYIRWLQDSFKNTDTIEQTDELANMALAKGYAVLVIDARNHGKRKNLDYNIKKVMYDLWFWGKREPYETMIIDTVKDHRVLLDWVATQPQFDQNEISVAGYSMGGQISLILASLDTRINKVLSIVPPASSDNVARVSPLNFVKQLSAEKTWLVTADNDQYANKQENIALFNAIANTQKHHIVIQGEHELPEGYYTQLEGWYE